ncbi:MAG TPA: alpha/beta hydrolase [Cellulomonas sp.]
MSTLQFLDRPEGRVAYTVDGPVGGRLVVLVPGMGDLRSTWRELAGPLVEAGYRVAATDLRGHGDSDTTFGTHGDVATAGDVLALLDELGGGPAVLVGNSMGAGAVAYAAAERPTAVDGLVLFGPFLRDPDLGALVRTLTRLAYPLLFARPWGARLWAGYYRSTLNRGRRAPWLDEHVAAIRASYADPSRLAQFRALTWQLTHEPVERRLGDVHTPVLAFVGRRDPDFRDPAAEAAWIEQTTGGRSVLLDDVAHYPQHQAPELVVPEVLDFLATLPTRTR